MLPGTPGFERLVGEYGERAFQFAYRLTNNVEDARELVQEAFCRAFKGWERFDRSQPVQNWFFTILRHVFLDGLKRSGSAQFLSLDEPVEDSDEDLSELLEDGSDCLLETLEREESGRVVRLAVCGLSKEHRAVLTLADVEGLSYEEIAAALDVPLNTVRSRLHRARMDLREKLERFLP